VDDRHFGLTGRVQHFFGRLDAGAQARNVVAQHLAEAAPNDLVLVVRGEEGVLDGAVAAFEKSLSPADAPKKGRREEEAYGSVAEALRNNPEANLALISVPGEYAGAEAMKALRRGLNVMLFSDNVPMHQEVALKKYASERGLLVMGPDCGTAIISGAPLAFANVVRRGKIGVVGASGTGMQEVTCLADQLGQGISQAIGTGGHDLSVAVGGLTMRAAIGLLAEDGETEVIALISKPPAKEVAEAVLEEARKTKKPVVVCFLGAPASSCNQGNLVQAHSLEEAAHKAVALAQGKAPVYVSPTGDDLQIQKQSSSLRARLRPGQKYLRGLYSGGTFCYEALLHLQKLLPALAGNTPTGSVQQLADIHKSVGHTVIDLGDDDFTRGKPHPMIDPAQRNRRLLQEADDPETAVLLLDVVLGYGAHPDPAGELAQAVAEAKKRGAAHKNGSKDIVYIGFICGTEGDPQNFREQRAKLAAAGLHLCASNIQAVALAGAVLGGLHPDGKPK
jgi:succinyl-CoA synthetase alpha subunit